MGRNLRVPIQKISGAAIYIKKIYYWDAICSRPIKDRALHADAFESIGCAAESTSLDLLRDELRGLLSPEWATFKSTRLGHRPTIAANSFTRRPTAAVVFNPERDVFPKRKNKEYLKKKFAWVLNYTRARVGVTDDRSLITDRKIIIFKTTSKVCTIVITGVKMTVYV